MIERATALDRARQESLRERPPRRAPRFLDVPFFDVVLTAHEIAVMDEQGPTDRGGMPTQMRSFQRRVNRETGELRLFNEDLRRMAIYAFGYGDQGRWQTRLLEVFQRTLGLKLDGDLMNDAPTEPEPPALLRVPAHFHTVADVLGAAGKMDLPNVLVLSERADGSLVFLDNGLSFAEANWLLDRMKALLLAPSQPMRD